MIAISIGLILEISLGNPVLNPGTLPLDPPKIILADIPAKAVRKEYQARPGEGFEREESYFLDDKLIARRAFWKGGEIYREILYKDGKKQGLERHWDKGGQIRIERPYENDRLNGTCRWWDSTGKFVGTFEMKNGTGLLKEWYPDGTLKEETSMQNGLEHGIKITYYSNGKKHQECGKSQGRSHGILFLWDEKGGLADGAPFFFVNGVQVKREEYLEARLEDPTLPPLPK